MKRSLLAVSAILLLAEQVVADDLGESGYADSGGVKIHYVTAGKGPLIVLIHGFPDFWYTWRAQMPELAKHHQVVAIDQRGYNLSDKPEGVENYAMDKLVGRRRGRHQAFRAGQGHRRRPRLGRDGRLDVRHEYPEMIERLVILNLPHPLGLSANWPTTPPQQKNSQYARDFQKPDAAAKLTPELLAFWVKDAEARKSMSRRSSARRSRRCSTTTRPTTRASRIGRAAESFPQVKCPVLMIHGLGDTALLPGALNDTWKWVDADSRS